jgi:EamA domain-containing membrane protein RarD
MKLTIQHHIMLRLRIHGTIHPVHPYTFQVCTGTAVLGDTIDNIQSTAVHTGVLCVLYNISKISTLDVCSGL